MEEQADAETDEDPDKKGGKTGQAFLAAEILLKMAGHSLYKCHNTVPLLFVSDVFRLIDIIALVMIACVNAFHIDLAVIDFICQSGFQ